MRNQDKKSWFNTIIRRNMLCLKSSQASKVQVKQSTPAGAPWPVGVIVYAKEQGSLKLPSSACLADDLYPLTEQGDNHDTDKFLHEWVHCSESG